MVLPVAPPSLFGWYFDILIFLIHDISTIFLMVIFHLFSNFQYFFFNLFLVIFPSFNLKNIFTIYFFEIKIFHIIVSQLIYRSILLKYSEKNHF
jgi:hypothetical protein